MATITFTKRYSVGSVTAKCTLTATYNVTNSDTATTVASTTLAAGNITATGGTAGAKTAASNTLKAQLSSLAISLVFNGATVASRTGVVPGNSYTFSGNKSVTKTHSAQTKNLVFVGSTTTAISVPAKTSYFVFYNNRAATNPETDPLPDTKWYNETLVLKSYTPKKDNYVFKGWATSLENARAGSEFVEYTSGANYIANAEANLYAVWELEYSKPTISNVSIERCKQDGTLDDDGTYALVKFDWSVFKTNEAQYYEGTGSPYSTNAPVCTILVGDNSQTPTLTTSPASVIIGNGSYAVENNYVATITLSDTQTVHQDDKTTTYTDKLYAALYPMDFNADATAVGFFRPAPDNDTGMHVHGDIHTDNHIFAGDYTGNIKSIFDIFYPVGSYYETSDSTFNPNDVWGGTWIQELQGQFHVSAGSSYPVAGALTNTSDGGAASVTLTAAQSGIRAHAHPLGYDSGYSSVVSNTDLGENKVTKGSTTNSQFVYKSSDSGDVKRSGKTSTNNNTAADASSAHENRPPYIAVYRWHRTA